jgi:hypothetical protein
MWYREILAYREVTNPKGERTIHQTGTQYEKPLFIFGDPNIDTQYNIGGAGSQWFGPGHYTAQSPAVSKGYKDLGLQKRREEKLPRGARILHYNLLTPDEKKQIINACNEKFGLNVDINSKVRDLGDIGNLFFDRHLIKINPILVELGYDAVEHISDTNNNLTDENIEKLKKDPEYYTEEGKFKWRKFNDAKRKIGKENIIIINRAIITKPDLFQKIRFRPDSVSPEELAEYKEEIQTTQEEMLTQLFESGVETFRTSDTANSTAGTNWLDLNIICNFLKKGKHYPQFDTFLKTLKPQDLGNISFEKKLEYLKILTLFYSDDIAGKLFSIAEIYENQDIIRNNMSKGPKNQSINKTREVVETFQNTENKLLNALYTLKKIQCNSYGCGAEMKTGDVKCSVCGNDRIAKFYEKKSNLNMQSLIWGVNIINSLKSMPPQDFKIINVYDTNGVFNDFLENILSLASTFKNLEELTNLRTKIVPLVENFSPEQFKKLNDGFKTLREKLQTTEQNNNISEIQPPQKAAYRIVQKTAGKVKYYFYNGESKPLRDHLQDIFPKANSVDIYYMVDTLRRKAMNDDDISRLLLEADLGNILPGYQNKR